VRFRGATDGAQGSWRKVKIRVPVFVMAIWMVFSPAWATASSKFTPRARVMVTEEPGYDACAGGITFNVKTPWPAGFVSVRSLPSVSSKELDRLPSRQLLIVCDSTPAFLGVIYPADGVSLNSCGIQGSRDGTPYDGRCRSGWISKRYAKITND
jgi:hypothetical protein